MAIVFESPQDRFGIAGAGTMLGNMLFQKGQQDRAQQFSQSQQDRAQQLESERINRAQQQQKMQGTALGSLLEELSSAEDEQSRLAILGKYGDRVDPKNVLEIYRDISKRSAEERTPRSNIVKSDLQKKVSSQVADTILESPKIFGSRRVLDRMRDLSKELQGPGGYAQALYGSSAATELNALGLTAIEPILKTFNPVGSIPVAKIEMIKNLFSPKATDLQSTLEGKFNAIDEFITRGEEKAEKFQSLYEEYGENIPIDKLLKYSKESEQDVDEIIKKANSKDGNKNGTPDELETFEELPDPKSFKGKVLEDEDTGKSYKSDGKKWTLVR